MWKKIVCLITGLFLISESKGDILSDRFESVTPELGLADPAVYSFAQDGEGYLWIGTQGGLNRYDGYRFLSYTHQEGDSTTLSHSRINCLLTEGEDLYIGTDKGVNIYNLHTDVFRLLPQTQEYSIKFIIRQKDSLWWFGTNRGILRYDGKQVIRYSPEKDVSYFPGKYVPCGYLLNDSVFYTGTYHYLCRYREDGHFETIPLPLSKRLKNNLLLSLIKDHETEGHLWLGTEQGLIRWHIATGESELYLPATPIKSMLYDEKGNLWIGTDNGLFIKPPSTTKFICNRKRMDDPHSLQNDVVWAIFKDREQNLWFGTDNGISLRLASKRYNRFSIREITGSNEENILFTIHKDRRHNLWLGGSNGLIRWNPEHGEQEWLKAGPHALSHNKVRFLYEDSLSLWIATDGGLNRYDYRTGRIARYSVRDKDEAFNSTWMYSIVEDKKGYLWLGTYEGGIFVVDKKHIPEHDGIVYAAYHYNNRSSVRKISSNVTHSLTLHPDGSIWTGTDHSGINRISAEQQKTDIICNRSNNLSSDFIRSLAIDSAGAAWVGTDNGLDYIPSATGKAVPIAAGKITAPVRLLTVQEDNIWFGTNTGITCYNRTKGNLNEVNLGQTYYTCIYYDPHDKRMYLGVPDGIVVFSPDTLLAPVKEPRIRITGYIPDKEEVPENMTGRTELRLPFRQNSFSLEFSSFLYRNTFLRYAYRLQGYDDEWRELPGIFNRSIYLNVPSGNYTFEVCNIGSDGSLMDNRASLALIILPPWYRTLLALTLYALLLAGLTFGLIRHTRLRHRKEIEQMKREKTLKLTRMKLDFFANVSHEFKTPLSLIIGYISQLLIHETDNGRKRQMQVIRKNADKLHTLINQMLDYKEGNEGLMVSEIILPEFAREVFRQFETLFQEKGITAEFSADTIPHTFAIDRVKMESALTNLLSNALKFTGPGGHIRMKINAATEDEQFFTAMISVEDDGCGIPSSDLPKVFDRYFISSSSRHLNKEGSGIGLALTHKIIKQHGGDILFRSEEGKGTCVTITLTTPKTVAFVKNETESPAKDIPGEKPWVLLVEDNAEIRDFIKENLSHTFRFLTAVNGKEGLEQARKSLPQLIITDLTMPIADGKYLCRALKDNVNTAFIPVIILTAHNDSRTELSAYEYADAFVTKPFDLNYLCDLSKKLIIKSRKFVEKSRQKELITPPSEELVSSDEQFLRQINAIIEDSLSDPDLNVSTLCRKSGMGDKQVYRKIKQLTGMSVVEYIRDIRLRKAAMFLRQDKLSVSEIMYLVGFSNASYFTRCFKETYGLSPKEFSKQEQNHRSSN